MGTLLTEAIFNELCKTRERLTRDFGADNVSGIHLPRAGDQVLKPIKKVRSLYVVGIAPDKDYAASVPPDFAAARIYCEHEWRDDPKGRSGSPWWRFVNGLTLDMYGKRHYDCTDCWGWSNLVKIAFNKGSPNDWPGDFIGIQKGLCVETLRYEFDQLTNATIFIGIGSDDKRWKMLPLILPEARWNPEHDNDGISFWDHKSTSNLYMWGCHPMDAQIHNFFDKMLMRAKMIIARSEQDQTQAL
jgi:hypothetical protein